MNGTHDPGLRVASIRTWRAVLYAALVACGVTWHHTAAAQQSQNPLNQSSDQSSDQSDESNEQGEPANPKEATPPSVPASGQSGIQPGTGGGAAPPLFPPAPAGKLPSGHGALSFESWLLKPALDIYSFYDSNIHNSPTIPLKGPGFRFHPGFDAQYYTGFFDTHIYGNIDSSVYPNLDYHNNTFNKQAGFSEKYSPLPDLDFTVIGNYAHSTLASVVEQSIATPVTTPGSPPNEGAAGIVSEQQTIVRANDTYTAEAKIYKQLNRAFVMLHGSMAATTFEMNAANPSNSNFDRKSYDGAAGFWLTPLLYLFGDGVNSFTNPEICCNQSTFRGRGGIGTGQIGLFQGQVYYGQQGTKLAGAAGGTAGGDIYGGSVSYLPSQTLNMSFSVSRQRNISNIRGGTGQALSGLQLAATTLSPGTSAETTTLAYRANLTLSPQMSAYFVLSDTLIDFIQGPPQPSESSWLAAVGIKRQFTNNLSATLDYKYTRFLSEVPNTSTTRNIITLGAHYKW